MQTFLPLPDFAASAACLDYRRLGKQRVEAWQILQTLTGASSGWRNHPAVRMWKGHEWSLCIYGATCCDEWASRGYTDNLYSRFREVAATVPIGPHPAWLGDPAFHASHRAALLAKDPAHYSQFGWTETPALDYLWPVT